MDWLTLVAAVCGVNVGFMAGAVWASRRRDKDEDDTVRCTHDSKDAGERIG